MPTKSKAKTTDTKQEVPVVQPAGTEGLKPSELEPLDKSPKRAFQTGSEPGQREYLTRDEAIHRGFNWLDTEEEAKSKKKKG